MTTIRRIRIDEARTVRGLYERMVAEEAAAYPEDRIAISEQGLDNFETYFRLAAVHPDLVTLVAERDDELAGFALAEISRAVGLPGVGGEVDVVWARDDDPGVRTELLREAVAELRRRGAGVIVHDDDATHPQAAPWTELGFEADVIRFSLYPTDERACEGSGRNA